MKNLAWLALLGVIACGGDDAPVDPDGGVVEIDASIDAPPGSEFDCPTSGAGPVCGTTAPPTTPATNTNTCNPLTQTGCNANEKCTWIIDQTNPSIGHIGCTPRGTVPIGCACTVGAAGATGYDDCVQGATCLGGTCKQICDQQGGQPTCSVGFACTVYGGTFETGGGPAAAGLCDPTCDPLTQCMSAGPATNACGSPDGAMPTRGCYGYDEFSCSIATAPTLTLTDRAVPRGNASGNPFLNGCAPGFIPMFFESTGSVQILCAGFCAALEIDNTPAHVNNGKGDPAAVAKLPNQAKPRVGNATCEAGKKGSEASSTCMFLWSYVIDDQGQVPGVFTPYLDTLGVCFAYSHFRWDADQNASTGPDGKEAPYPDCATLPPRSAATTGVGDDAADWGCQKVSNSMFTSRTAPMKRDVTVRALDVAPAIPHAFH